MSLLDNIKRIPVGYSEGIYLDAKYRITKSIFNGNKSFKIYAKELKGKNFISLNYYITTTRQLLKPCEMPKQKVIDFIKNVSIIKQN